MKLKSIKLISLVFTSLFSFSVFCALPTFATDVCNSNAATEVKEAAGCPEYGNSNALPGIIQGILNSIILVVGIIAVIFVVIGGINYITSTGDPGKTKKARDTILYALIGIIVCALAFAIVNWTIGIISNSSSGNATESTTEDTADSSNS